MAERRLLTLEDLYSYYAAANKDIHFNAHESRKSIVVQVGGTMRFAGETEHFAEVDAKRGLVPVTLWACHTQENLNGSQISQESMESALPSFANRPILGYIHEVDGEPQFADHAMHIDENGELVYDETPVGVVPESCNAHLEEGENGKLYCVVNGYLFAEYNRAAEILQREGQCDVSVELSIEELAFDSETGLLDLKAFTFDGVTILGVWEDGTKVNPAMPGSHIKISDFSKKRNSVFQQEDLIKQVAELTERVNALTINSLREGGKTVETADKNEVMEVATEEAAEGNMSTEVEETPSEAKSETEETTSETMASDSDTDNEAADENSDESSEAETFSESEEEASENTPVEDVTKNAIQFAVTLGTETKTFAAKSLSDIIYGLTDLVNTTYAEDGTWYMVDVFDGGTAKSRYVVMTDCYTGLSYRQAFTVKDGEYTLKNERVAVHQVWMTDEEEADYEKIRGNYAALETEVTHYREEPEKMEILTSEDYANVAETEAFQELVKPENHFALSVEDVKSKADALLLDFAKGNRIEYATKEEKPKVGLTLLPTISGMKGSGRYGSLFSQNK